jgi:hypothetical protein
MESISFTIPFLPPSLNAYRRGHWREQRRIEREWKDMVAVRWLEMGRPACSEALVTLWFLFPDRRSRDLDNYLATGSKLVGDAIKGRFIPDDSPRHLKGWRFFFGMDREKPGTVVEIERWDGGRRSENEWQRTDVRGRRAEGGGTERRRDEEMKRRREQRSRTAVSIGKAPTSTRRTR